MSRAGAGEPGGHARHPHRDKQGTLSEQNPGRLVEEAGLPIRSNPHQSDPGCAGGDGDDHSRSPHPAALHRAPSRGEDDDQRSEKECPEIVPERHHRLTSHRQVSGSSYRVGDSLEMHRVDRRVAASPLIVARLSFTTRIYVDEL